MISLNDDSAVLSLLKFAVGVEAAQIIIVLSMLLINFFAIVILGFKTQKWELIVASMVLSQSFSMAFENWPL